MRRAYYHQPTVWRTIAHVRGGMGLFAMALASAGTQAEPVPAAALPDPELQEEENAPELGLGALQVVAGVGIAVAGLVAVVQGGEAVGTNRAAVAVLAIAPALQGVAVCAIGQQSDAYQGGCGWPILGAYLGLALFVPLAFLAAATARDPLEGGIGAGVTLGLGLTLGGPAASTWAWHATKTPYPSETTTAR